MAFDVTQAQPSSLGVVATIKEAEHGRAKSEYTMVDGGSVPQGW